MAVSKTTGLVSLNDAKRYLGKADTNTADDRLIDAMVMHASVLIQKELGYNVRSQSYREFHSGDGQQNLWLENFPVTGVDRASIDRNDAMTINYGGGDASYATAEVTSNSLRLRSRISGVQGTDTLILSDSATMTLLETAVEAVSNWTSTIVSGYANYAPADLIPAPARDANDADVTLGVPDETQGDYELFGDTGRLYNPYNWDTGHNNILIEYTAGYSTVPEPIQSACLELVAMFYNISQKDASLRAEKIGDYSYTIADRLGAVFSAAGKESVSNTIKMKLEPYMRTSIYGA